MRARVEILPGEKFHSAWAQVRTASSTALHTHEDGATLPRAGWFLGPTHPQQEALGDMCTPGYGHGGRCAALCVGSHAPGGAGSQDGEDLTSRGAWAR